MVFCPLPSRKVAGPFSRALEGWKALQRVGEGRKVCACLIYRPISGFPHAFWVLLVLKMVGGWVLYGFLSVALQKSGRSFLRF